MMEERCLEQEAWERGMTVVSWQNGTPGQDKGDSGDPDCHIWIRIHLFRAVFLRTHSIEH